MEAIKEKLLKIKRLADRGFAGEATAAQLALEKMLLKYNLTIDDIFEERKQNRAFTVPQKSDFIFVQVVASVIGNRYKEMHYYASKRTEQYLNVTDAEYFDIKSKFEFHSTQLNKELEKNKKDVRTAYCYKHDLFNHEYVSDGSEKGMSLEEYMRIKRAEENLEDVSYTKQLPQ